jgi:tripartite-type tricarboxylate transporter receptor subunit TctC
MTGLMANEVHLLFTGSGLQHVRSGKLKALAVADDARSELLPEVPTMASQGLPGFKFETIGFIVAPRGTPKPIIDRLNREIVRIMSQPEVKKQLLSGGSEAVTGTPAQLEVKLKAEDARMRKILKSLGLEVKT